MPVTKPLSINNGYKSLKFYIGPYYTVYSGPSTQYESVGSVFDMYVYWIDRRATDEIDQKFHGMTYIRYQVTGTNTWKSGYITYAYQNLLG